MLGECALVRSRIMNLSFDYKVALSALLWQGFRENEKRRTKPFTLLTSIPTYVACE